MTSQLPCKQEGWNSLPMIHVWLLLSWNASQSELTYPQQNLKACKDHRHNCTGKKLRHTGLYWKWLWHQGGLNLPISTGLRGVSRCVWHCQVLKDTCHPELAGRHLSTPHIPLEGVTSSHRAPSTGIRGMDFPASSFSLRGFTSVVSWRWQVGDYNTGADWFWTLSFLMRVGRRERGTEILQVKEEEKIV